MDIPRCYNGASILCTGPSKLWRPIAETFTSTSSELVGKVSFCIARHAAAGTV